jgi:hypothetical protein
MWEAMVAFSVASEENTLEGPKKTPEEENAFNTVRTTEIALRLSA